MGQQRTDRGTEHAEPQATETESLLPSGGRTTAEDRSLPQVEQVDREEACEEQPAGHMTTDTRGG